LLKASRFYPTAAHGTWKEMQLYEVGVVGGSGPLTIS
jgi:hypothetical protein